MTSLSSAGSPSRGDCITPRRGEMSASGKRLAGIAVLAAIVCVAIGLYIGLYLTNVPGSANAVETSSGTNLYLSVVAAAAGNDPHPTWVSYYAVDAKDQN